MSEPVTDDRTLGLALTVRFLEGVTAGEWRVVSLTSTSATEFRCGTVFAADIGADVEDEIVLLVAIAKKAAR